MKNKIYDINTIEENSELSFVSNENNIKNLINTQLKIYNDKYKKNITFDSMYENLKALSELTDIEKEKLQAVFGNHIFSTAFLIEYKAAITVLNYFDKFLNSVSSNEQVVAEEFSAGILKVILDFLPKINKLKEQYNIINLEKVLNCDNINNNIDSNEEFRNIRNEILKE